MLHGVDIAKPWPPSWRSWGERSVGVAWWAWFDHCTLQFESDPNIVIAKMDATANDYPYQYEVRG